jgi:hypothetical protein
MRQFDNFDRFGNADGLHGSPARKESLWNAGRQIVEITFGFLSEIRHVERHPFRGDAASRAVSLRSKQGANCEFAVFINIDHIWKMKHKPRFG